MPDCNCDPNINSELKKNPAGGANIRRGGPFDFSPESDEETNRKEALERYDRGIDNPVRPIL